MNVWEFMSENPWLTFFLFMIIAECVVELAKAVRS